MDQKRKEELLGKMDEAREKHLDNVINNMVYFRIDQDGTWHDRLFLYSAIILPLEKECLDIF